MVFQLSFSYTYGIYDLTVHCYLILAIVSLLILVETFLILRQVILLLRNFILQSRNIQPNSGPTNDDYGKHFQMCHANVRSLKTSGNGWTAPPGWIAGFWPPYTLWYVTWQYLPSWTIINRRILTPITKWSSDRYWRSGCRLGHK